MRTDTPSGFIRPVLWAGLAVAALTVLASCGSDDPDTDAGQAGDSSDELFDVKPIQIDEASLIDDSTVEIVVSIGVEPCHVIDEIAVDETDTTVEVTVTEGSADPEAACIEIAEIKQLRVELDQPMGDRTLIDGATGEEITMNGSGDSDDSAAPTTAPADGDTSTTEQATTSTTAEESTTSQPSTSEGKPGVLVGVRAHSVDGVSLVDDTTIQLLMTGDPAPCFVVDRVEKVETESSVELTVYVGSEPDVACIAIVEEHSTTVTLDSPLGDRTVIDGSNGNEL